MNIAEQSNLDNPIMLQGRSTPLSGTLSVDLTRSTSPYNRMLFGQSIEHFHRQIYGGIFDPGSPLSDARGLRQDVIAALRELRVPIVRWPGGCFVSSYHWRDGIGPSRNPSYDKAWRVEEPNTFGTDEFIAWCREIGAEPYICTNAGTGTPEEMSDWVEYCNGNLGRWAAVRRANGFPNSHHVRYWSIGNENYGFWEMGAKTRAEWGSFVRESAKMMRHVDESIVLLAAATSDPDWTLPLLQAAGPYLDYISVHGYYDLLHQHDNPLPYEACIARSLKPEHEIRAAQEIIATAGFEGKIKIAFDEWNLRGWHHPEGNSPEAIAARDRNDLNSTYTMADALFSASFLNTCIRHAQIVHMANMAPIVNTRGPLFVHPEGIVRRTTFHVLKMYATLLEPNVVESSVVADEMCHSEGNVPALDALVTCNAKLSQLSLVLVNRHPDAMLRCRLNLGQSICDQTLPATVLSGQNPDSYNDIDQPDRVAPVPRELAIKDGAVELLPHSVTVCHIKLTHLVS